MTRSSFFLVAVACGFLFVGADPGAGVPAPPGDWGFEPDPSVEDAPALQGSTWTERGQQHSIWLKHLDDAERLAYIERQTGVSVDPFRAKPGQAPRFFSFLMVIENRTASNMEFNPMHSWVMTNKKEIQSPLAMTDLGFDYRMMSGRDLPPTYRRVAPALLDLPRTIKPGEKISGLLVYRSFKRKAKRFTVDAKLSLSDGEVVKFTAYYRRINAKKGKQTS